MTAVALDTSIAIALLTQTHQAHDAVRTWCGDRKLPLSGHALAETYSLLTRLPSGLRRTAEDAARLIEQNFAQPLLLGSDVASRVPQILSQHGIVGGAVYDAPVGLAAARHGAELATRDERARSTYELVGAQVVVVT